jgi:hypothetical protein
MRTILTVCLLFLLSFSVSGQSEKWKQKNARINFAITPQLDFIKIGGKFGPTAGLSGAIAFNNTHFLGGYVSKKFLRSYGENPLDPSMEIDVNYQNMGIEYLYAMKLGVYRTEGGHYVNPKLRIVFGIRLGGGTFWLQNTDKNIVSTRDYFYYIQPQFGIAYPLNDYITLHTGVCMSAALSVDNLEQYYPGNDFLGPGAYLAFKFTVFR